jgi:hypothetical protein
MAMTERRTEQTSTALAKARAVRVAHGNLRKALKARQLDPFQVIEGTAHPKIEEFVKDMKLVSLLPMVPGVGKSVTHEILLAFDVSPTIRMGQLTPERRQELSRLVKGARWLYD